MYMYIICKKGVAQYFFAKMIELYYRYVLKTLMWFQSFGALKKYKPHTHINSPN